MDVLNATRANAMLTGADGRPVSPVSKSADRWRRQASSSSAAETQSQRVEP